MKIKVKRFESSLPLPEYKTTGAAAMDLVSREEVEIDPGKVGLIPLNLAVAIPEGYVGLLFARSSTHKLGLILANGVGVIDSDYCGDEDEIKMVALNFTNTQVKIDKGTRVAQVMLVKPEKIEVEEVEKMGNVNRGGFGSTGNK